jgi:hypothetical protein
MTLNCYPIYTIKQMSQLSPLAQWVINEMRDIYAEECIPDHVHVQALSQLLLANNTPPHVVALVKELEAHLT